MATGNVVIVGGTQGLGRELAQSLQRTPIGRLVTMAETVSASRFLFENEAINGINLVVDGGWTCV